MSWIGFICQTLIGGGNDPIKNLNLLRPIAPLSQTSSDLNLEGLLQLGLIQVQLSVTCKRCEVITMYNYGAVLSWMIENTRVALANSETDINKDLRVCVFPYPAGIPRAVGAPNLSGDHVRSQSHLWRELHVDSSLRDAVGVRLADVDKANPQRLAFP